MVRVNNLYYPLQALREGTWFKLICGASYQHLPAIRNLTLAFALAGADCVDVAADPAVIAAAKEGLRVAASLLPLAQQWGVGTGTLPWLMVSLNDGEDPHFRKAEFDPQRCPPDCSRPCEAICPAQAIAFQPRFSGVIDERCYGCGRCLPLCPIQQIVTRSSVLSAEAIAALVLQEVDAVEIHTQVGRLQEFARLWQAIAPHVEQLKLVAISCPDGEGLSEYLHALHKMISPLPCPVVWQTDGRPMSGDIGDGATRACVRLGQKVLAAGLPGYVQLAGGTNRHTVPKLKALGLLSQVAMTALEAKDFGDGDAAQPQSSRATNVPSDPASSPNAGRFVSGVAYGSYARGLLAPVLEALEVATPTAGSDRASPLRLEAAPDLLKQATQQAHSLVSQLKPVRRWQTISPSLSP